MNLIHFFGVNITTGSENIADSEKRFDCFLHYLSVAYTYHLQQKRWRTTSYSISQLFYVHV